MMRTTVDVLVIGSGFAGSLTALLMKRIGRTVALIDSGRHPRFAIGESSTPLADLTLRSLSERYDLPQFLPLCNYGRWKVTYPELVCGEKRGFSYFRHEPGSPFQTDNLHSTELLVTANRSRERADTHWMRSDVDHFFARQAAESGVLLITGADVRPIARDPWCWEGTADGEPVSIEARFVVDASGSAGAVATAVGVESQTSGFQTSSCSLFAHFEAVEPWHEVLERLGVHCGDYPFQADRAAVHHLLEEGWMWQLPFDNGVTSIGFVLDRVTRPADADDYWQQTISRYPTIAEQVRYARIVAPPGGLVSTARLQRRWKTTAGRDWALLPGTAGFIDPLHSTGIAHSLSGVERIVRLIDERWGTSQFQAGLATYDLELAREFQLIDHLVAACYATRDQFDLFTAATMLYFVAAIHCEERRLEGGSPAFLGTDDQRLYQQLLRSAQRLISLRGVAHVDSAGVVDEIRTAIQPWNRADLLQPERPNMYLYTGR